METGTLDPASPQAADAAKLERAKRRLAAIKGFYVHLLVFALVLSGLFVINAATGNSWWVLWVLFGWGIGVVAHALAVFGRAPKAIEDWEDRKLKQLMNER
jgi:steroid 5-alpha reductase family enzyme